ncbi:MAG: stage II sporulation protein M [Euryarchaeota archaeon]|nr:stage II sporulation protein M [Euryarchaeota archaeon]
MIGRSAAIYLSGFAAGALSCAVLLLVYPPLYHWFLELLRRKVEAQSSVIEDPALMIGSNNLFASFMLAYGGYITARIFLWLDTGEGHRLLRRLERVDPLVRDIRDEDIKYYLALFAIPVFILFFNGFILGSFLVLYIGELEMYFSHLFPHGYFEFPAILLAGSIGLEIAYQGRAALSASGGRFKRAISGAAASQLWRFLAAVVMIVIGANLEAGGLLEG